MSGVHYWEKFRYASILRKPITDPRNTVNSDHIFSPTADWIHRLHLCVSHKRGYSVITSRFHQFSLWLQTLGNTLYMTVDSEMIQFMIFLSFFVSNVMAVYSNEFTTSSRPIVAPHLSLHRFLTRPLVLI